MKIALASPPFPKSLDHGLQILDQLVTEAAGKQAEIICFPESFLPGYRVGYNVADYPQEDLEIALKNACEIAARNNIAIILPMDWHIAEGMLNIAQVISNTGEVLGYQSKNQLDPSEDKTWVPGETRQIFEVNGVKFGIVICHEGFRYPELTRWAVRNGAQIVFHPHCSGSDIEGPNLTEWGHKDNPYYEKAMMMRALENTVYFASSNYGMRYSESATSLIGPDGTCLAYQSYGQPGILVADIELSQATGYLAKRFKPEWKCNLA